MVVTFKRPNMPLTKEEFFNRKIFLKESVPALRNQYPDQTQQIDQWYGSIEYNEIQAMKSTIEQKFKAALEQDDEVEDITYEFIFSLYNWWTNADPVCHYCGLPESALEQLHQQEGHINKRWPKRGKSLELDRKQSDLPYTEIDNLTLACYWCNNAKTDTFTYQEFRAIGKVINKIWAERLNQHFPIPEE